MRRLPIVSAAVLLCCAAMSATSGAEEPGLSGDQIATDNGVLVVHPVNHATFVMQWNGKTVYVDPVGGAKPFADLPKPDLVLVTHHHFDHFDPKTLERYPRLHHRGQMVVERCGLQWNAETRRAVAEASPSRRELRRRDGGIEGAVPVRGLSRQVPELFKLAGFH